MTGATSHQPKWASRHPIAASLVKNRCPVRSWELQTANASVMLDSCHTANTIRVNAMHTLIT